MTFVQDYLAKQNDLDDLKIINESSDDFRARLSCEAK